MNFLNQAGINFEQFDLLDLFTRMSVALLLSSCAGAISFWGHRNRKITESLLFGGVTLSLVITMILLVLSANIFYALGLFAALSIIRFRTPIKDVRDTLHLFLCIGIGIACGAGALRIAVFCTLFILSVQQLFRFFSTQKNNYFIIKVAVNNEDTMPAVETFLKSQSIVCEFTKAVRPALNSFEYFYHLTTKQSVDIKKIMDTMNKLAGVVQIEILPCKAEELS